MTALMMPQPRVDQPLEHVTLFNQMAGPLFRELALDLASRLPRGATLITGHPDTVALAARSDSLKIVPAAEYDRRNRRTRLRSWLQYSLQAFARMLSGQTSANLVVTTPPTLGVLAYLTRVLTGRPYYVLVYDLYPDTLVALGVLGSSDWITRVWRAVNRRVWNRSLGVFTIGHRMASRLAGQFDPARTPLGQVEVVPLWVDTDQIRPVPRPENPLVQELGIGERVTVLYSGNMGYSHDIDSILHASELLRHRDDVRFVLIGGGAKWHEAKVFSERPEATNIQVLPFQPEERLPLTMSLADISLVALDQGMEGMMIPSKTYYYMAGASAIIAICDGASELVDTVEASRSGFQVPPGESKVLAARIEQLLDDRELLHCMRTRARAYCVKRHARKACTDAFIEAMMQAARTHRG